MTPLSALPLCQAHGCPICLKRKRDELEVERLEARLKAAVYSEEEEIAMQVALLNLKWDIKYAEFHDTRRHHQRGASQDLRPGLGDGEEMWFIDYVSYYKLSGSKQNVLVFEVERKIDGAVDHFYYDYVANSPHDGFFTTAAVRKHLEAPGNRPANKIYIFCDNGMARV